LLLKKSERFPDPGKKADLGGMANIPRVFVNGPVPIQKDRR
jgi:hypothetical protein